MKVNTAPRSDQWNADDFIGSAAKTFTIANVTEGTAEGARHDIHLTEGAGRVWRPPVTMLRIMEEAWGSETDDWIGKRVTLYRDSKVRFGKETPGGIRISHMSHLPRNERMVVPITTTRSKRALATVDPLPDEQATPPPAPKIPTSAGIVKAFSDLGVTLVQLEARIGGPQDDWTPTDIATLAQLGRSIKAGETTVAAEFDGAGEP